MILFRTREVLAIDKPPGVSMATSSREGKSAEEAVARLLAACGEPADQELLLVHRLDVGTSGVVLLAKGVAAHRALSSAFQSGGARKTYRALVWGRPRPAADVIVEPLGRDPRDGRKMKVRAEGKRAVTRYETLSRLTSVTDLQLFPETGRTHQIRVHLSARGHPIVGDDLYGGASRWHGVRDATHRRALSGVTHPLLHAERIEIPEMGIDVAAPLPKDYTELLFLLKLPPLAGGEKSQ
ncbi:MAG TPA: RNA pseudouridine synthase [Thermoanaerobaculia bacterium]|jgi:23S rRNA pseudouridine1911/1915/1917 synthase|nr:RNA pseudouridine synthase [Thermoanaerobaculia bacterium]